MSSVRLYPSARADIFEITDLLFLQSGRQTLVRRFLASVEETTEMLVEHPGVGRALRVGGRELRHFALRRFHAYRIFYTAEVYGITIVRVLHGARDLGSILEQGADLDDLR